MPYPEQFDDEPLKAENTEPPKSIGSEWEKDRYISLLGEAIGPDGKTPRYLDVVDMAHISGFAALLGAGNVLKSIFENSPNKTAASLSSTIEEANEFKSFLSENMEAFLEEIILTDLMKGGALGLVLSAFEKKFSRGRLKRIFGEAALVDKCIDTKPVEKRVHTVGQDIHKVRQVQSLFGQSCLSYLGSAGLLSMAIGAAPAAVVCAPGVLRTARNYTIYGRIVKGDYNIVPWPVPVGPTQD